MPLFKDPKPPPKPPAPKPQPTPKAKDPAPKIIDFSLTEVVTMAALIKHLVQPAMLKGDHPSYNDIMAVVYKCKAMTGHDYVRFKNN